MGSGSGVGCFSSTGDGCGEDEVSLGCFIASGCGLSSLSDGESEWPLCSGGLSAGRGRISDERVGLLAPSDRGSESTERSGYE